MIINAPGPRTTFELYDFLSLKGFVGFLPNCWKHYTMHLQVSRPNPYWSNSAQLNFCSTPIISGFQLAPFHVVSMFKLSCSLSAFHKHLSELKTLLIYFGPYCFKFSLHYFLFVAIFGWSTKWKADVLNFLTNSSSGIKEV